MITCNHCDREIEKESNLYKATCGHWMCEDCRQRASSYSGLTVWCDGVSRAFYSYVSSSDEKKEEMKKMEEDYKRLKTVEEDYEKIKMENEKLKEGLASLSDNVVELKAQLSKKPDDPIDCSDCKECFTERKMYICNTCSEEKGKTPKEGKEHHDLKSIGLCSNCVVMDHIVQKHEVVPLFPVVAEMQYKTYAKAIDEKKSGSDKNCTNIVEMSKGLIELSDILKKYADLTTEMIKTSKSSTFQAEFNQLIIQRIDEFKETISEVDEHITSDYETLKEMLTNFNSQVSEMCNDKCTDVDDILVTLIKLKMQQQSIGNKKKADSTDA